MTASVKRFEGISRRYITVSVEDNHFVNENGEILFRIETKGAYGKTLYRNSRYVVDSKECSVYGMGGATGHGWGGQIMGYLTLAEIENSNLKIK